MAKINGRAYIGKNKLEPDKIEQDNFLVINRYMFMKAFNLLYEKTRSSKNRFSCFVSHFIFVINQILILVW